MNRQIMLLGFIALLVGLIFQPEMAYADIFLKQKHHRDSFQIMGQTQPAKDFIQTVWITKDTMRSDSEQNSLIIRLDKQIVDIIDHTKKTYTEMPLNFGKVVDEAIGDKAAPEEKQAMSKMIQGMMKFSMTVTDTGEKKKINTWNCSKYIQQIDTVIGPINSELWATQDLKMDYELFAKYNAVILTLQPGLKDSLAQAMKEAKKIQGVTVLTNTTSTMMGAVAKSSVELLEFKEGKAPVDIATLPAGYKKQPWK
jgi:hypothetical protein